MHDSTRWLLSAVTAAVVAAAALPQPVAAATTWHVGADGSGDGPCAKPDIHTIQAGIDGAGVGDTIVVCPGRYSGPIRIVGHERDGLTVRASESGSVRILGPSRDGRSPLDALVRIEGADDVRLEGLRIVVRGTRPCRSVWAVVQVSGDSARTTIISNRIYVADADTTRFRRGCGYQTGIEGGALVAFNLVEDWGLGQVSGTGIHASPGSLVIGNTLRFGHPDELTYDWDDIHVGIVTRGAHVVGNRILGLDTSFLAGEGPGTPIMLSAIDAVHEGADIVVGNLIRHAYAGIEGGGPDVIMANVVQDGRGTGIALGEPAGARIARNTVERSAGLDCFELTAEAYEEESGEEATGEPNVWTNNIGTTSLPPGLCVPR